MYELSQPSLAVVLAVVSLVVIPEGSAVVFAVAAQYPKWSF
jgi:hypothetical protein